MVEELDMIDKAILRTMLRGKRPLTTRQIAEKTEINWRTAHDHLRDLKAKFFVKNKIKGKTRRYIRNEKKVEAEREIVWSLNVKKKKTVKKGLHR